MEITFNDNDVKKMEKLIKMANKECDKGNLRAVPELNFSVADIDMLETVLKGVKLWNDWAATPYYKKNIAKMISKI